VTYSVGNKAAIDVGDPEDGGSGKRKVTVAAINDGDATLTATATHWALSDTVSSRLLAAAPLAAGQAVTAGNVFTLPAFGIFLRGVV
jgi:hypothetical protein